MSVIQSPDASPSDFFGSFTVQYVNFFDSEVENSGGDWKKVLERYLYEEPDPLINGMTGGRMSSSFPTNALAADEDH